MLPEVQAMSPDARLAAGRCPECGIQLAGLDTRSHRASHWLLFPPDQPECQEARRRYKMLSDLADHKDQDAALAAARAAKEQK